MQRPSCAGSTRCPPTLAACPCCLSLRYSAWGSHTAPTGSPLNAGVYLGFAFSDGRLSVMLTELFVALAFTAAALAGAMSWPVWIAVALGAHGLWDWAHHRERVPTHMPRWYVPFCAVFDWVYAAGLLGIWWREGVLPPG